MKTTNATTPMNTKKEAQSVGNQQDGGTGGIACGHADLRCAEGMLCSRSSPLRSNPKLRRGSHPNP
jgi:hypothetical protein